MEESTCRKTTSDSNQIFSYLERLENGSAHINEVREFCERTFYKNYKGFSKESLVIELDRPLRVCGMVKNEGQPGGGHFL